MKTYKLGLYEKAMPDSLTIAEKLAETAAAGYDYMEMSIDESDAKLARLDWTNADIADIRSISDVGVPIKSICLSGHRKYPIGDPEAAVRAHGMEIMEKSITLAESLGARIIMLAGYDVYYTQSTNQTRRFFAENLRRCAEMAAAAGVTIAFETMETNFMNTVYKAVSIIRDIDSPWLQIYPDLGNITNAACGDVYTVNADLSVGAGHISAMHLKETKPGVFRELPYGDGHVNFVNGVSAAYSLGVRMFVGEFWYDKKVNDWRRVLKDNALFLRDIIETAILDIK